MTIGITGHRWNKIQETERARIREQLTFVFAAIDLAVHESPVIVECAHPPVLRLLSSLAEGADQLAVWSRPETWVVDAILPFPRARYLEDFAPARATGGVDRRPEFEAALAQARSVVELPDRDDAVRGYELAGEAVLRDSNLLVAVWDGNVAEGPGGTEAVVTRAISLGIPVIWICSKSERAPALLFSAGEAGHSTDAVPATADLIRRTVETVVETVVKTCLSHPAESRKS